MTQKNLLLATALTALLVIAGAFWYQEKRQTVPNPPVVTDPVVGLKKESEKEIAEKYARNWGGETTNWRVYMNEELGFALRYPEEVFNFRILPVSSGVGVYSDPLPPKEFSLSLTQKGYGMDDFKHQIWMNLNSLTSEKEYYAEADNDFATSPVVFAKKKGKILGTKETILKQKSNFEAFLNNGTCNPETITVVFDDIKNPNGDVRSYIHVGCEGNDGNDMGRIYRAIYQSIKFF